MKAQPEYQLQTMLRDYLLLAYPDVDFDSDTIGSIRLTVPQAARNKRIQKPGFKKPDIEIHEARHGYHRLFLELKAESPFKKDGTLKRNEHLESQAATMARLTDRGNLCHFVWTFEDGKRIIDDYLRE